MDLKDKVVLVTGACAGIGKAIVSESLELGAKVIGVDIVKPNVEMSNFYQMDISSVDRIESVFQRVVEENPDLNCLVNNAGIYLGRKILDYSLDEMRKVLDINIIGTAYLSKLFCKFIMDNNATGNIVNISSVSGQDGSSDAVYGMSKAALGGLTKSLAMNFAPNIRVNTVAPGLVETHMLEYIPKWRVEEFKAHQLNKEFLKPEQVAKSVCFLLSDDSRGYTGATLDINNGCYLR